MKKVVKPFSKSTFYFHIPKAQFLYFARNAILTQLFIFKIQAFRFRFASFEFKENI